MTKQKNNQTLNIRLDNLIFKHFQTNPYCKNPNKKDSHQVLRWRSKNCRSLKALKATLIFRFILRSSYKAGEILREGKGEKKQNSVRSILCVYGDHECHVAIGYERNECLCCGQVQPGSLSIL